MKFRQYLIRLMRLCGVRCSYVEVWMPGNQSWLGFCHFYLEALHFSFPSQSSREVNTIRRCSLIHRRNWETLVSWISITALRIARIYFRDKLPVFFCRAHNNRKRFRQITEHILLFRAISWARAFSMNSSASFDWSNLSDPIVNNKPSALKEWKYYSPMQDACVWSARVIIQTRSVQGRESIRS